MSPDDLDPLTLDRELARTAAHWRRHLRRTERGEGLAENPFELSPPVATKEIFVWVHALPDYDPLKRPLARWVHRLLEQRVNLKTRAALETLRHVETHVIDVPEHGRFSWDQMLQRALAEPARRDAWLSAWTRASAEIAETSRTLWERRTEIAHRLALASPDVIEQPGFDPARLATEWLARTDDLMGAVGAEGLSEWLTRALGPDAPEAGPTRLTLRALADYFRETRLFEHLTLDPKPAPENRGLASLMRALGRLGAAFHEAAAPRDQPFCVAHDPYGLERHGLGALFAGLPLSLPFAQRGLGLGRDRARDLLRVGSRVALMQSRVLALRVQLRAPALAGGATFLRAFEEHASRALGFGVAERLAGALFPLRVDDAQRFLGMLSAASRADTLVATHDEDWYRNPRASEELRAELARSPRVETDESVARADADALLRVLSERLA